MPDPLATTDIRETLTTETKRQFDVDYCPPSHRPLALVSDPRYQLLISDSLDKQLAVGHEQNALEVLVRAANLLRWDEEALPRMGPEQMELLNEAARRVAGYVGRCKTRLAWAKKAQQLAHEALVEFEAEWRKEHQA